MPAHTSYPTADDLETALKALNLFTATSLDAALPDLELDERAAEADAAWESMTGWHPFLADASAATRYYDPPGPNQGYTHGKGGGRTLYLDTGIVSLTSIYTDWSPDDPGDLLEENEDFWLRTYNASLHGTTPTAIEFAASKWSSPRSVRIIGRFGYATTLPDDVWGAIRAYGLFLLVPDLKLRRSRGMVDWTEAGTSERYGEKMLEMEAEKWEMRFRRTVNRYKRVVL